MLFGTIDLQHASDWTCRGAGAVATELIPNAGGDPTGDNPTGDDKAIARDRRIARARRIG